MNSCDYYQELISSLIDGEISHDEHEALMAHLNTCSRCNAMYAVFHDLSNRPAHGADCRRLRGSRSVRGPRRHAR